ncbi:MAG: hypothetical protein M3440_02215 [Chloroflexota bacterium]|nr:hypothetical protein [Chloroflexota bacterium]
MRSVDAGASDDDFEVLWGTFADFFYGRSDDDAAFFITCWTTGVTSQRSGQLPSSG